MRVAGFQFGSIVDGPGLRNVVFTQGCPHGCPGCHNPNTHDPSGGTEMPVSEIVKRLVIPRMPGGVSVTISGGDPFVQPAELHRLVKVLKELGCNIWIYTGFTWEEVRKLPRGDRILKRTDVLVDGPFVLDKKSFEVKFRGSTNQRLVDVGKSLKEGRAVLWEGQG